MRTIVLILCFLFIVSCKKEANQDFGTSPKVETTEDPKIAAGEKLFKGRGMCASCHHVDKKVIGPSIKEMVRIYKEQNADMKAFLREEGKPIVDANQYEIMRANLAITKVMTDEELESIIAYMYSFE
jgi:cytochrome c